MGATLFAIFFCLILAFGFYLTIQILTFALQSMLESRKRTKRMKRMRFWVANAHAIFGEDFVPCPGFLYASHPRLGSMIEIQTTAVVPLEGLKDEVICLRICQPVNKEFRKMGRGGYVTSDYFYSVELYDQQVLEWDGRFASAPDRGDVLRDQVVRSLGIPTHY